MSRHSLLRSGVLPALLVLLFVGTARADRSPVPDDPEDARLVVREAFADDFLAAKTPSAKTAFALKLLESVQEFTPAKEKYGLIAEAIDVAIEAGAVEVATRGTKALVTHFDVDPWDHHVRAYTESVPNVSDASSVEIGTWIGFHLTFRLLDAERYEQAATVSRTAVDVARETRNQLLGQLAVHYDKRARMLLNEAEKIADDRKKLAANPDDPDACTVVGLFRCVHEENWDAGLALPRRLRPRTERRCGVPQVYGGDLRRFRGRKVRRRNRARLDRQWAIDGRLARRLPAERDGTGVRSTIGDEVLPGPGDGTRRLRNHVARHLAGGRRPRNSRRAGGLRPLGGEREVMPTIAGTYNAVGRTSDQYWDAAW